MEDHSPSIKQTWTTSEYLYNFSFRFITIQRSLFHHQKWIVNHVGKFCAQHEQWSLYSINIHAVSNLRPPGGGKGKPFPSLENPMDRGALQASVLGGHKESGTMEVIQHALILRPPLCLISIISTTVARISQKKWNSPYSQQKSPKCSIWVQSQK